MTNGDKGGRGGQNHQFCGDVIFERPHSCLVFHVGGSENAFIWQMLFPTTFSELVLKIMVKFAENRQSSDGH